MQPARLPLASTSSPPQPTTPTTSATETTATATGRNVETVEQPPPQQQQQPALFAGLLSSMERNAQQWRSNFSQMVLRPLQQHAAQQTRRGSQPIAQQPQQQQQQQQQQQPPLNLQLAGQQQLQPQQPPLSLAASQVANNLLQSWMPSAAQAAAAAAQPALSRPASVIINLDARGAVNAAAAPGGSSSSSAGNGSAGNGASPGIFVPAGGYSLIDAARLAAVTQRQQQAAQQPSPTSTGPLERPSQFDARRAQLIIDLQTNPPHPTPSSARSPLSTTAAASATEAPGSAHAGQPRPAETGGADGSPQQPPQAQPQPPPPTSPPTAAAQPTTQPADFLVHFPEGRELIDSALRYVPYALLVLFKYMFDHMDGIINVALLLIMFTHANWLLKKQVARQKLRSIFALVRELTYVTVVLLFVVVMLGGSMNEWVWLELLRSGGSNGGSGNGGGSWQDVVLVKQLTDGGAGVTEDGQSSAAAARLLLQTEWPLRRMLYCVLITDLVAKLCTVHVKICVTLLPPCAINFRNRGRIYLFIEGVSQMVRSFLPVLPWLVYLLSGYEGYDKIFGVMLTLIYVVVKGGDLLRATTLAKAGLLDLFKIVSIGANPSKEELQAAGDTCPICHDRFVDPMRLTCSHIFCEECVATWFDREPTCPLCRALVGDDPAWRDGATSHFIQFF